MVGELLAQGIDLGAGSHGSDLLYKNLMKCLSQINKYLATKSCLTD
jgi:hypothetical protein